MATEHSETQLNVSTAQCGFFSSCGSRRPILSKSNGIAWMDNDLIICEISRDTLQIINLS